MAPARALPVVLVVVGSLVATRAVAEEWRFTRIAQPGEPGLGGIQAPVQSVGPPVLNEAGEMAFMAALRFPAPTPLLYWDVGIVFRGDTEWLEAVSDPATETVREPPDLNDAGQVVFASIRFASGSSSTTIWRWSEGGRVAIADDTVFEALTGIARINEAGQVSFTSHGALRNGVYVGDGSETGFSDYDVIFEDSSSVPAPRIGAYTDINDAGHVVFGYSSHADPGDPYPTLRRVLVGNGVSTRLVAEEGVTAVDQSVPLIKPGGFSMNDSGHVAFDTGLSDWSGAGVFLFDGSEIRTLVLAGLSDPLPSASLALNDRGEVAYVAFEQGDPGGFFLFVGDDLVLRYGDPLDGVPVEQVRLLPNAFNDARQLALWVQREGLDWAVYLVEPVEAVPALSPVPGFVLAATVALAGLAALRRGRSRA